MKQTLIALLLLAAIAGRGQEDSSLHYLIVHPGVRMSTFPQNKYPEEYYTYDAIWDRLLLLNGRIDTLSNLLGLWMNKVDHMYVSDADMRQCQLIMLQLMAYQTSGIDSLRRRVDSLERRPQLLWSLDSSGRATFGEHLNTYMTGRDVREDMRLPINFYHDDDKGLYSFGRDKGSVIGNHVVALDKEIHGAEGTGTGVNVLARWPHSVDTAVFNISNEIPSTWWRHIDHNPFPRILIRIQEAGKSTRYLKKMKHGWAPLPTYYKVWNN